MYVSVVSFFGWAWLVCSLATSMFMTNILLLRWTLGSVPLPLVINPTVVKETLQCRYERRAQVQSYINQTEMTSELNNAIACFERHFRSKNN